MDFEGDDTPKWRLEHSVSDKAGCQQAACKRAGVKIAKGELRIGTQTWFEQDVKYITMWRHWGCATPKQIEGLKQLAGDSPESIPGYSRISPESQEQVRLALEQGRVVDKEFKDIRSDLAKFGGGAAGREIRNAVSYKVEVTARGTAGCRGAECKANSIKIAKGELRLGIATMWDEEHETWVYKHWKCISAYDLYAAKDRMDEDSFDGIDKLPEEYKTVVLDSFKTGQVIEPPKLEAEAKPKKARAPQKKKVQEEELEEIGVVGVSKAKGKGRKQRTADEADDLDDAFEPAPKKKRGRAPKKNVEDEKLDEVLAQAPSEVSKPVEAADPQVAKIQALAEQMRSNAGAWPSKQS